jgi:Isochorismatase family
MPTTLDPATALVLIDLQHGITALPTAHSSEQGRLCPRRRRCNQDPHRPKPDPRQAGPGLRRAPRRRKVTGIVLAGISTSIGVESTARAANERGYELTDAITDTDEDAHLNSLRAIFPRIAELATTEEVLTALPAAN